LAVDVELYGPKELAAVIVDIKLLEYETSVAVERERRRACRLASPDHDLVPLMRRPHPVETVSETVRRMIEEDALPYDGFVESPFTQTRHRAESYAGLRARMIVCALLLLAALISP
jgi:hypothetical protein